MYRNPVFLRQRSRLTLRLSHREWCTCSSSGKNVHNELSFERTTSLPDCLVTFVQVEFTINCSVQSRPMLPCLPWKRVLVMNRIPCLLSIVLACFASSALAQTFDERFDDWPVDLKINGRILMCSGDVSPEIAAGVLGRDAADVRVRVCTIGSPDPDRIAGLAMALAPLSNNVAFQNINGRKGKAIESNDFDLLIVLVGDGEAGTAERIVIELGDSLKQLIAKGGTLVVDGPIVPLLGRIVSQSESNQVGVNLVPDAIISIDTDSTKSPANLHENLNEQPRAVGLRLAPETALLFSGRTMRVLNDGSATFLLPACEHLPIRTQTIRKPEGRRQAPEEYLVDWTEWRRDSIERTLEPFPPAKPELPFVENGTLFIVGGGGMPDGLMQKFVDAAGGNEARLIYVPCSEQDEVRSEQGMIESWTRMGVAAATMVHTKDRNQANTDEEFSEPLRDATGIWFGGGRQWNLADSYYGTKSHELMKAVVQRGGVVGGTSAGASIQARYLARATPIGNFRIMAPGYERGGLGFITGVAIDQHFTQRGRQKDMAGLVKTYPQLLGIGIDEATAIIVRKSQAEITGRGKVFFYDAAQPIVEGEPDCVSLPAGSVYDLANRKTITDTNEQPENDK